MKRAVVVLVLIMVFLTVATSVVLAKPGNKVDEVCWVSPNKGEKTAYFMMTGSGIVHRFMDGRHDIYKPKDKFKKPGGGGWTEWTAKSHDACAGEKETDATHADYLEVGKVYWHKHN
jgi:hypothetical protein